MKGKPTSKSDKIRMVFSQLTLLGTVAFGAVTTMTLIEAPSRTLSSGYVQNSASSGRAPASVAGDPEIRATSKKYMSTVELKCIENSELKTFSEHVRIKGTHCKGESSEELLSGKNTVVKNLTNGYVAAVFSQGDEHFTTDYVTLSAGKNDLIIEETSPNGRQTTRNLQITRE